MTTPKNKEEYTAYYHKDHPYKKTLRKRYKRISKNTHYKRGRQFEYRCKKYFEKLGYYVIRKYASKGAEDLVCIKKCQSCHDCITSKVLLVQCKNLAADRKLSKPEIDSLLKLAEWTGAKARLAKNINHKIVVEELN